MATRRSLVFVAAVALSLWSVCLGGEPSQHLTVGHVDGAKQDLIPCSVYDLLPLPTENNRSSEWSEDYVTETPYNCTCPTLKAR